MAEHLGDEPERIEKVNLKQALSERYLSYALSTITARSLPDLRDGLKPVQRRILYAMLQLRMDPARGFKKCARVVGDVIGKFHPHGDTAVYDAMVRMAQGFAQRYPLVDGQGNFGNIDGDNAAAMRYTESRLTAVAMALLDGLDEDTVDFHANYDGSDHEPAVLPAAFPNLLANGATGIAVGMATNIPPHNVSEIIDASIMMLDRPPGSTAPDVATLIGCLRGPDLPTGGILIEPEEVLIEAYRTGRGSFRIRARWQVEKLALGQYQIIVDQIPYQVQKSRLIERIADLLNGKKLSLLGDLRDESSSDIRIVLIPKSRSVQPEALMEQLFKRTELESRLSLNLNVLDRNGVPGVLGVDAVLSQFLSHRMEVLVRRTEHRLAKIEDRLEVVDGYLKAFLDIDRVIAIIREEDEPKSELIAAFELSERQAEAILNLRLRHLRRLEEMALNKEQTALRVERRELKALLADEGLRRARLIEQLKDIRDRLGDERRTRHEVAPTIDLEEIEEAVERLPVTVICSKRGWFRVMRGHLDASTDVKYKDGDGERFVIRGQSNDKLLAISTDGRAYCLGIDKLPSGRGQGEPISLYLEFAGKADLFQLKIFNPAGRLIVATRDSRGFIVEEKELAAQTRNGRQTVNLAAGDSLVAAKPVEGDHIAVVGTNRKLLVFRSDELPVMSRGRGVILQRYRGATLSDITALNLQDGLSWPAGSRTRHEKDLSTWIGRRASAGRLAPTGFPKGNMFLTPRATDDA